MPKLPRGTLFPLPKTGPDLSPAVAHHCTEGVEDLFEFLRTKQIGQKQALFYQAWAMTLENKMDFDGAMNAIERGIAAKATPLERLITALEALTIRRESLSSGVKVIEVNQSGPSRTALLQLPKAESLDAHRSGKVPEPMFSSTQRDCQKDHAIEVYTDENGHSKTISMTSSSSAIFSDRMRNKENFLKPTNWKEPLSKPPLASRAHLKIDPTAPPIRVFVDETLSQNESKIQKEINLRKRLHGAPVAERLRVDPLTRICELSTPSSGSIAGDQIDYERSYDAQQLMDEQCPDGLSFEEVRARDYLQRQVESHDDMPMTVNYSQILNLKGSCSGILHQFCAGFSSAFSAFLTSNIF